MKLPVRTPTELETMREAGRVVAAALAAASAAAVPGAKLAHLDDIARTVLHDSGARSPFLGYKPSWAPSPFNGVLCLSPNEMVVHGRPSGRRVKEGDLLSIDAGAGIDGWYGDSAVTVHVGGPRPEDTALRRTAEAALAAGIAAAVPGATLADVGAAIDAVARRDGYAHLLDHGGHGIGREMHESPFVFNEATEDGRQHRLVAGNTIAIEPMLMRGDGRYRYKKDGWAVYTADGARAAHVEHTIAVTDDGPVILTAA
jgi:methionyl aminopeptidase